MFALEEYIFKKNISVWWIPRKFGGTIKAYKLFKKSIGTLFNLKKKPILFLFRVETKIIKRSLKPIFYSNSNYDYLELMIWVVF